MLLFRTVFGAYSDAALDGQGGELRRYFMQNSTAEAGVLEVVTEVKRQAVDDD